MHYRGKIVSKSSQ